MPSEETLRNQPVEGWVETYLKYYKDIDQRLRHVTSLMISLVELPLISNGELTVTTPNILFQDEREASRQFDFSLESRELSGASHVLELVFHDFQIDQADVLNNSLQVFRNKEHPSVGRFNFAFIPQQQKKDTFGALITSEGEIQILESGSDIDAEEEPPETKRFETIFQAYGFLANGLIGNSREIGTHASQTVYEPGPHPFMADIIEALATNLPPLIRGRAVK